VTSDLTVAAASYSALFGRSVEQAVDIQPSYFTISNDGHQIDKCVRWPARSPRAGWCTSAWKTSTRCVPGRRSCWNAPSRAGRERLEVVALVRDPQGAVFGLRTLSDAAILAGLRLRSMSTSHPIATVARRPKGQGV
jgi:hypothetical protein